MVFEIILAGSSPVCLLGCFHAGGFFIKFIGGKVMISLIVGCIAGYLAIGILVYLGNCFFEGIGYIYGKNYKKIFSKEDLHYTMWILLFWPIFAVGYLIQLIYWDLKTNGIFFSNLGDKIFKR